VACTVGGERTRVTTALAGTYCTLPTPGAVAACTHCPTTRHAALDACTWPPALLSQARGARKRGRRRAGCAAFKPADAERSGAAQQSAPSGRAAAQAPAWSAQAQRPPRHACEPVEAARRPARPPCAAARARPHERAGCFLTKSRQRAGYFLTKIFHPNVAKGGEICVNVLKRDWARDLGLRHVLLVVRCLLVEPFPESALNEEAGSCCWRAMRPTRRMPRC